MIELRPLPELPGSVVPDEPELVDRHPHAPRNVVRDSFRVVEVVRHRRGGHPSQGRDVPHPNSRHPRRSPPLTALGQVWSAYVATLDPDRKVSPKRRGSADERWTLSDRWADADQGRRLPTSAGSIDLIGRGLNVAV